MRLIDEQQAIDALMERFKRVPTTAIITKNVIENLPSAETEPNTGHWVSQRGGGYCCSECGRYALDEVDGNFIHVAFKSNYCPHCGADMRGERNGRDS